MRRPLFNRTTPPFAVNPSLLRAFFCPNLDFIFLPFNDSHPNIPILSHHKRIVTMVRPTVLLLLALWIPAFMPHLAQSQSRDLALEELAAGSEVIAAGSVTDLRSEWNSDRTRIFTRVTIAVDSYLKGERTGSTLEVVVPGGEVGEVGEQYSHTARFSREEQVVVFGHSDNAGNVRVTGGEQGKFSVRRDERTNRMLVGDGEVLEAFITRVRQSLKPLRQD
jgi:hypothetical protein